MADLIRKYKIHILNHGISYSEEAGYTIEAITVPEDIRKLAENDYQIQILEDMNELGKARQREVGKGNRYTQQEPQSQQQQQPQPTSFPLPMFSSAVLKSTSYLNIDEVETALSVATAAPYTAFTKLIPLPESTWEGRYCNAIKIANDSNSTIYRPGVYFLGGVHAREWGRSDILIYFVEQLERAYQANKGITLGAKSFSASDIQTIVNTLDILIFPQANQMAAIIA